MQPIVLGPNRPEMFYRGDGRIDRLRGTSGHEDRPGRGSTVLIPYAAGPVVLAGTVEGVRCLPAE